MRFYVTLAAEKRQSRNLAAVNIACGPLLIKLAMQHDLLPHCPLLMG